MARARWFFLVSCLWFCAGCGDQAPVPGVLQNVLSKVNGSSDPAAGRAEDAIRIGSFNIQVFGSSKLQKTHVMQTLADVARQFDVLAIQEIRSKDDDVMAEFLKLVNADGGHYEYIVGPRLGRTVSKEQYAFLFDTRRIEVDLDTLYTVNDPDDLLHREPYVARFRTRGVTGGVPFTFTLVNIHTDPDETKTELDALADVFLAVHQDGSGEDDVIILGDLNVDEHHLGRLGQLPGIVPTITGVPTNTRQNKTYDNLVLDRRTTTEFLGRSGVLNLLERYKLTEAQALEISDHMPVWAEFQLTEQGVEAVASRPDEAVR